MKYLSVCSGIEAATVAWHGLGWKAAAYSEIEAFPSAVLAHHYPDIPNVGDMTKFKEWNIEPGTIDLLVGGTPCQSFSVAGLRKGLADPRGNLALVYCGILDHLKPRWFVWENVPGVLSSGGGRDFGSFLGAVAELGYGFAYRVLDAQFFGVAQRRRRVFVVGYLGDWRPAAKVLFERESLRGDSAPSREKGQRVAPCVTNGAPFSRTGNERVEAEAMVMQPITFGAQMSVPQTDVDLVQTLQAKNPMAVMQPYPVVGALYAGCGPNGHGGSGLATLQGATQGHLQVTQPYPVANTLTARMHKGINSTVDEGQTPVMAFHPTQDPISSAGVCHSIGANENATAAVATGVFFAGQGAKAGSIAYDQHIAPTLKASDSGTNRTPSAHIGMQVRRLTPVECERLQGFPDNYTAIPWRGKADTPDGPRYKALGNSMAVPVMAWIGRRIQEFEAGNAS